MAFPFSVGSKSTPAVAPRPSTSTAVGVDALLKAGGKRFESTSALGDGKFESVVAHKGQLYNVVYSAKPLKATPLSGAGAKEALYMAVVHAKRQGGLTALAKPPTADQLRNSVAVDISLPGGPKTHVYIDKSTNELFVKKDGGWGNTSWSAVSPTTKSMHGW